MEVTMGWRLVIICCFLAGVLAVTEGACDLFQVPPSQQVNAEEDTVVRFNISETCNLDQNITSVGVVVKDDQNKADNKICRIRINTAEKSSKCSCHKQGQSYSCQVKYMFPRQPEVRWELRGVPEGRIKQQVISFNVTYPTVLTNFTIASHTTSLEVGTNAENIQLHCTWKDGNPQRDVRIFNPHNKTLDLEKYKEGDNRYYMFNLAPVQCNDSGLYRCEVADSGQSLSVSLLVRCVLEFLDTEAHVNKKTVQLRSDARLKFAVHSYTPDLHFCWLTTPRSRGFDCNSPRSEVVMMGTPPQLQLQLRLKNVMEEDAGTWQLQAGNIMKSNHSPSISFTLDVTARGTPWLYIGVGCAAVLILIIIVIVIYFGFLRPKRQRTVQGRRPAPREIVANAGPSEDFEMITNDFYGMPDPCEMITNDLYGRSDDGNSTYEDIDSTGHRPCRQAAARADTDRR